MRLVRHKLFPPDCVKKRYEYNGLGCITNTFEIDSEIKNIIENKIYNKIDRDIYWEVHSRLRMFFDITYNLVEEKCLVLRVGGFSW